MNTRELNKLTEQKIKTLTYYMISQCGSDDDAFQDQCIGIYEALKRDPYASNKYLKKGAKWKLLMEKKRGRSVDNGYWNRDQVKIIHSDQYEAEEAASLILADMRRKPLDIQVIEKIAFERFFETLNHLEKSVVKFRMENISVKKIMQNMRISQNKIKHIKVGIKLKIEAAFAG